MLCLGVRTPNACFSSPLVIGVSQSCCRFSSTGLPKVFSQKSPLRWSRRVGTHAAVLGAYIHTSHYRENVPELLHPLQRQRPAKRASKTKQRAHRLPSSNRSHRSGTGWSRAAVPAKKTPPNSPERRRFQANTPAVKSVENRLMSQTQVLLLDLLR